MRFPFSRLVVKQMEEWGARATDRKELGVRKPERDSLGLHC